MWKLRSSATYNSSNDLRLTAQVGASPALRDRGAKLKSGGQSFFIIPELDWGEVSVKIRWSPKKRSSPKSEGFFWSPKKKKGLRRNSKAFSDWNHSFKRFFRPKTDDLQNKKQKKVFAEIGRLFLADFTNSNVFFGQNQQLFPPQKIPWGGKKEINPPAPAGNAPERRCSWKKFLSRALGNPSPDPK